MLLDINNLLCRAYFTNPKIQIKGIEMGAILGLESYIKFLINSLLPTHMALVRDLSGKTWRHNIYHSYKNNRKPTEEDLRTQFSLIPEIARKFNVPLIDSQGFEADDCIATLTKQAHSLCNVTIVSTDKDLAQLLHQNVRIYNPHNKNIEYIRDIETKYGIAFSRFIDYFILIGDPSDNLPGIQGIGPKTALQILQHCPNLDHMDSYLHHFKPAIAKKLHNQQNQVQLMRKMLLLDEFVPLKIPFSLENAIYFKLAHLD